MRIDLEPLDPELGALLATARARDAGDPSLDSMACERLLARVERQIMASGSAPPPAFAARLWAPGPIATVCAAAALAGVIAASMRPAPEAPLTPPPVIESSPSPSPETTTTPDDELEQAAAIATVSVDDLPSPAASVVRRAPSHTKSTGKKAEGHAPNERAVDLAGELRIVDAARIAVARQQPAEALRLLAEHEQRYPGGQLAQQRERLRIEALVATGDVVQARSRAAAFRNQHPSGLLLPSLERALEGDQARER